MYLFECEATFDADPAAVWQVWTDVDSWPEWDVSKEIARLDGEFRAGSSGWAKQRGNLGGPFSILTVEPGRRWVTECPLPLGRVSFDHLIEPAGGGRVRVVKGVAVEGGFARLVGVRHGSRGGNPWTVRSSTCSRNPNCPGSGTTWFLTCRLPRRPRCTRAPASRSGPMTSRRCSRPR
ncbi:MAG TPA: SRPBCC family protein [Streptosporangiaceae bacterium]|nr:SRPBCC family protein [Streptosporangiaceae bacterium]